VSGIHPSNHSFQGWERLIFFQIGLFSWLEETHVTLQRQPFVLEAGGCRTLFPCENWVTFWKQYFQEITEFKVEICHNCSRNAFSAKLKEHMCLSIEPSVLESAACKLSSPERIELVYERNTSWKSQFSSWRKAHLVPNRPTELSWRKTGISQKKTISVRSIGFSNIVAFKELSYFLKGILPET
jgi:hypothetical protein